MRGRLLGLGIFLAVAAMLLPASLRAQTISGIIAGRVTDEQQKPLSGVAITAHNPGTGRDFPASTSDQGYYRILEVPPGSYEVTGLLGGFQTEKHISVRVDVGRTTVEDFTLKIQTKEETVTVESTAPMAVVDSPTLSTSFPEKQVEELPILTRDVNNLALLAPGVLSVRTFSFASTLVPFSVNGSRGRDNNFIIDSVDNNEPLFGGAATQFTNSDVFAEYTILTAQEKAEFGRNSGATVNAITKSGSNMWHGTAFGFGQSDLWNAMDSAEHAALLTSPEPFYDVVLGATLGGPVKKDKAFFFISYQWDHLSDNLTDVFPVLANYPTSSAGLTTLQGLPSTPGLQAYLATPTVSHVPTLGGTTPCFAGKPLNNGSGLYQQPNPCLVTSTGVPVMPIPMGESCLTTPQNCVDYNVWNVPNGNNFTLRDHEVSGRYDQVINNSNDFYSRYFFDDLASPQSVLQSPGVAAFGDLGLLPDYRNLFRQRTQSVLADHRYYRVNALNEFRVSYSRVSQSIGAFDIPKDLAGNASAVVNDTFATAATMGSLGGQGGLGAMGVTSAGLFPSVGSDFALGQPSSNSNIASNTYQIQDNYSYTVGRHSLKFGVNFVRIDTNVSSMPDNLGFYLYTGSFTGNGLQDFVTSPAGAFNPLTGVDANLATVVSQRLTDIRTNAQGMITGLGPNEVKIKEFDQFYFAQDDWRLKDNLTLSLGFRYENFGQPINSIHDVNKLAPTSSTDNKDFAPRLGFAWSPGKSWVVRGGYGIAYDPPVLNIPLLIWQSGPVSPLLSTDNLGLAQLQPTGAYPKGPLNVSDFQQSYPNFFSLVGGIPNATTVNSGMVQGCSQYYDLYDALGGPGSTFADAPGRFYDAFAVDSNFTTVPASIPIQNCASQNTVAKNLKNPYLQTWSLGIQKEFGANYLLEVNYIGSKGSRLFQRVEENPFQGWNANCVANLFSFYNSIIVNPGPPPVSILNLAVPGQCRYDRIDNSHGDITKITNGGSSSYNALQISFTKRWSNEKYFGNFAFTTAYTWSHLIDNTSEIFGPGFITLSPGDIQSGTSSSGMGMGTPGFPSIGLLFDPLANAPVESITPLAQTYNSTTDSERGNSSFDRRNRFVASFLWEPFPKRNVWLRDWQFNGIYTYQSGQPFTPLNAAPLSACADTDGSGVLSNSRPDIGNKKMPLNTVALLADPNCLDISQGYDIFKGTTEVAMGVTPAEAATMAHFVQRPLFANGTIPNLTLGTVPTVAPNPSYVNGSGATVTFPAALYAGTAGRNILVGPPINNFDFSVIRNIKLTERFTLQARAEFFDLFNHPIPGYFNGSPYINNASGATAFAYNASRTGAAITGGIPENAIDAFNQINGAKTFLTKDAMNTSSRRIQFGLKLIF